VGSTPAVPSECESWPGGGSRFGFATGLATPFWPFPGRILYRPTPYACVLRNLGSSCAGSCLVFLPFGPTGGRRAFIRLAGASAPGWHLLSADAGGGSLDRLPSRRWGESITRSHPTIGCVTVAGRRFDLSPFAPPRPLVYNPGMSEERKKAGVWPWAVALLVAVLVGYPLSRGPAFWVAGKLDDPIWLMRSLEIVYTPFDWAFRKAPKELDDLEWRYFYLWNPTTEDIPPET
jgi:hypothetical protein